MPNAFDDISDSVSAHSGKNAFDDLTPSNAFESARHARVTQGNPYALSANSPIAGEGEGQMTLEGIGRGLMNVGRHLGNLLPVTDTGEDPQRRFLMGLGAMPPGPTHPLVSDEDLSAARHLDQPLMSQPAGRLGSVIGETAGITPAAMAASSGLGAIGLGPVSTGALVGAGQGAVMNDPGERGKGALVGAASGAALPLMGHGMDSLIYGVHRTPEAQQLIDRGVRLTPGQMNPEGVWNKIEENVRSVPLVGNVVERARTQAQQDFQRGVIEESAAPNYHLHSNSRDPNELFQEAQDSYAPLYAQARNIPATPHIYHPVPNAPPVRQPLWDALQRASQLRTVGATQETRDQAQGFLQGQLEAFQQQGQAQGQFTSSQLIDLRSRINEEMRNAGQDQTGRSYRQLLQHARDRVTDSINSQIPPDAAHALQTANDAYPQLAIIRDAIRRGGDQPHGFTPAQLSAAVKEAADNNQYARGGGLMRDWSSAGRDIFTERNPRTGASHGTTGTLLGGAYALHHYIPGAQIPAAAASLGALGMIGTQTGREILGGSTAPQQFAQRLAQALQQSTTEGQREIARTVSRSALNRAAALRAFQAPQDQP